MLYVDDLFTAARVKPAARRFGNRWCHLSTDGPLEELHQFAATLGLSRAWFQPHATLSHYDLTPSKRMQAVGLGAREITTIERLRIAGIVGKIEEVSEAPVPLTLFADAQTMSEPPTHSTPIRSRSGQHVRKSQKPVPTDTEITTSLKRTTDDFKGISQHGTAQGVNEETAPSRMQRPSRQQKASPRASQRVVEGNTFWQSYREQTPLLDHEEVRREAIDGYEYLLTYDPYARSYHVRCSDLHNTKLWLDHGPFTETEGHAFIDSRVARSEGTRRV